MRLIVAIHWCDRHVEAGGHSGLAGGGDKWCHAGLGKDGKVVTSQFQEVRANQRRAALRYSLMPTTKLDDRGHPTPRQVARATAGWWSGLRVSGQLLGTCNAMCCTYVSCIMLEHEVAGGSSWGSPHLEGDRRKGEKTLRSRSRATSSPSRITARRLWTKLRPAS
jgi:hypothetical protein